MSEITENRDLYINSILKKYHSSPNKYSTPIRRISEHKRNLVSKGLPRSFSSESGDIIGTLSINELGNVIVSFNKIYDIIYDNGYNLYLLDAPDKIMDKCKLV